jgi:hypothetical protein
MKTKTSVKERLDIGKIDVKINEKVKGDRFGKFAATASSWLGTKWAFLGAILVICLWVMTGPLFHYSDTWQLVINTGTTIVTFLMVFLIQNTQNRDARAINLKLDELIFPSQIAFDNLKVSPWSPFPRSGLMTFRNP